MLNPKPRVLAWWVMFLWSFGNPGSFLLPSPLTSRTSEFPPFNRRREERKWKDAWRCFIGGARRWWPMLSFSTARVAGKCSPAVWPRSRETQILIWVCVTKGCTNAWEYSGSEWAQQGLGLCIKVIFVFKKLWQSSAPPPGTVSLFRQGYNAVLPTCSSCFWSWCGIVKRTLESCVLGAKSPLGHLLTLWIWASRLSSWSLNFLIVQRGQKAS